MKIYFKIFKASIKHLGWIRTLKRARWTLGLIFRAQVLGTDKVVTEVYWERLSKCHACPLFNREDKTCGTLGQMIDGSDEPKGCWCYIPMAAHVASKQCWIAANEDLPVASAIKGHRWTR